MTTVKTISGLQKRALREGLSLLHEDGHTFNVDGSTSEVPRRLPVKPKSKPEERPQEPARESSDMSRIAEALERALSLNHTMPGKQILLLSQVMTSTNKENMALFKEILAEMTRLRKVLEKAPTPSTPSTLKSWEFDIERTRGGFIDKISAKPVYRH